MRFVYLGNFTQVRSTEEYIALALESLGHSVQRVQEGLDTIATLPRVVDSSDADVFLFCKMQLHGFTSADAERNTGSLMRVLARIRKRKVCWIFDLMRQDFSSNRYAWAKAIHASVDLLVTTDSQLGFGACVRQGYPGPTEDKGEPKSKYRCDVTHLGDVYGHRRVWLREMRMKLNGSFAVHNGVFCDDLFDLAKSTRIVMGPPYPYYPGYWSNRIYLATGYGACFAAPEVQGMAEEGWQPWVHYVPLPLDHGKAAETMNEALKQDLEHVRRAGQQLCWERFTYKHRAEELCRLLS